MGHEKRKGFAGFFFFLALFVAMASLFVLTLWYVPFSAGYILCAVLIGAVSSLLLYLQSKRPSPSLSTLNIVILVMGRNVEDFFFDRPGWMVSLQYMAIVFGVSSCFLLLFGKRFDAARLKHKNDA